MNNWINEELKKICQYRHERELRITSSADESKCSLARNTKISWKK